MIHTRTGRLLLLVSVVAVVVAPAAGAVGASVPASAGASSAVAGDAAATGSVSAQALDFGVELEQRETVVQGGDADVSAFVNNLGNQSVSNTTVELRVDADANGQFESDEVVASRGESFAAGEYREVVLRYRNVGLSAGNYSYVARVSKGGESVRSYTNGTLTVTAGGDAFDFGVELQQRETVARGGDANVSAYVTNLANQPVSNTTVELLVDADDDARFESGEVVASQGRSFAAGAYHEVGLRYRDVDLSAGNYSYMARVSKGGQSVRSYTNGTLTVTGGEDDDGDVFDFGVELEQRESVQQGGDADVSAYVNNLGNQPVSNTTVELLVDSDADARFESGEVVASRGESFAAGEYREVGLRYRDVDLSAGNYSYMARVSKAGRSVRSYTNGTLTVTGGGGPAAGCRDVTTSGYHALGADVTNSTERYCINVTASDVVLDGQGHTVDGVGATQGSAAEPPVGVYVDGVDNVTVRNLTVAEWQTGVVYRGATGHLRGVDVLRADGDGVVVDDTDLQVWNGTFTAGDDGFQVERRGTLDVDDSTVSDAGGATTLQRGFRVTTESYVNPDGVTVSGAAVSGLLVNVDSYANVTNTEIRDSDVGVELGGASHADVTATNVTGATEGLNVTEDSTLALRDSRVADSGEVALHVADSGATVEGSRLETFGTAGVVVTRTTNASRVRINGSDIVDADGVLGVDNRNGTVTYVDATGNYWGAADGPSSGGFGEEQGFAPFTDPVTGAPANGSGTGVSMATRRPAVYGTANVHFDSYRASPVAAQAGDDAGDDTGDGGNATTANATFDVVLDGAPDGLQRYNVTVAATGGTVAAVEPGLLGSSFEVFAGGAGEASVTGRAVDLGRTVGAFEDSRVLFSVTVEGARDPTREDLAVTVSDLVNDDGASMDASRVRLVRAGETCPTLGGHQTADHDGDGRCEDVDGDGRATFDDAVSLAFVSGEAGDHVGSFDFDGDGDVDFDDAVALAFQV